MSNLNQLRRLKNYQTGSEESPDQRANLNKFNQPDFSKNNGQNLNQRDQVGLDTGEPSPDLSGSFEKLFNNRGPYNFAGIIGDEQPDNKDRNAQAQPGGAHGMNDRSQQPGDENLQNVDDIEEFIDLSNIQNVSDLNELIGIDQKQGLGQNGQRSLEQDEVDVDQVEVDLDEDEIEEMERIMRSKMNLAQKQLYQQMDKDDPFLNEQQLQKNFPGAERDSAPGKIRRTGDQMHLQDIVVDTPPSNFNFNESDGHTNSNEMTLENSKKFQNNALDSSDPNASRKFKIQQQKKLQENQHQQIQKELRELLAQSSSEQLLMINDENEKMNFSPEDQERANIQRRSESFEVGEQPLDQLNENFQTEAFENSQKEGIEDEISSPPLVQSRGSSNQVSQKDLMQNFDIQMGHGSHLHIDMSTKVNMNPHEQEFSPQNPIENGLKSSSPPMLPSNKVPHDLPIQSQDLVKQDHKKQFDKQNEIEELKSRDRPQKKPKDPDRQAIDLQEGEENDSFHRLYNKEIKVNQDEIPLLLLELTDIAYKFIKKDQYEKAYVLLQKTESVLEVVNLDHSKRDRYFAYITYHNMAMCFQKLGMLEECIIYLKETIQVIEKPNFFKDISISQRMKQMQMQCQLKLQVCAILSQTQKHTEAMENAKISVRVAHQILRDMYDLCVFYSNKIKFKDDFASLSLLLMDDIDENQASHEKSGAHNNSKNDGKQKGLKPTKSEINEKKMQKEFIQENSPVRDIPYNILEESISMIERTALKLLPIMKELGNRLAGTNGKKGLQAFHNVAAVVNEQSTKNLRDKNLEENMNKKELNENIKKKKEEKNMGLVVSDDEDLDNKEEDNKQLDIKDADFEVKNREQKGNSEKMTNSEKNTNTIDKQKQEDQVDMRTILGFLNQNEWILNLNIGNIMQIQPIRMKDFMQSFRNEHQLSRESFLEKLQLLIVSYFCVSTEMRFIIQSRSGFMKAEVKKEKELEQEYWHVKALDIACAFLPSECPLFNHILLSYQKHHDPSMQPIEEDKEQEDVIKVLRPLKGIENSKYQPMIRELNNVYIDIAELPMSPLSKCFDKRLQPKKVKTASMNIQTDPIEEPEPPLMKSQSVSVQEDLKIELKMPEKESERPERQRPEEPKAQTETKKPEKTYNDADSAVDVFDANHAYMDLSCSKYQEKLISKIIEDPKINDKQQFLSKLITRVNSQEPDKFMHNNSSMNYGNTYATANPSQSYSSNPNLQYQTNQRTMSKYDKSVKGTLSADPSQIIDEIYGGPAQGGPHRQNRQQMANKGSKITQSGQLYYKNKGKQQKSANFDEIDLQPFAKGSNQQSTFDKSHGLPQNHVRSLYGDASDVTAMGVGTKHHIVSQSLAPSQSVFTEKKVGVKSVKNNAVKGNKHTAPGSHLSHKKNQSISGGNSQDIFSGKQRLNNHTKQTIENHSMQQKNFDQSVNSMTNVRQGDQSGTRKKPKYREVRASSKKPNIHNEKFQANQSQNVTSGLKNDKQFSNINLSNQKLAVSKKPQRYLKNHNYKSQKSNEKSNSREKKEKNQASSKISAHRASAGTRDKAKQLEQKGQNFLQQNHQNRGKQLRQKLPATHESDPQNEGSLIQQLNDVMSSSSQDDSNADPDLHPQPHSESHCSDTGLGQRSPEKFLQMQDNQNNQMNMHAQSQNDIDNSHKGNIKNSHSQDKFNQKMRPTSVITNYTSSQSGLKSKYSKQRNKAAVSNVQNQQSKTLQKKQLSKMQLQQQQQNIVTNLRQMKQRNIQTGNQIVPKKKSKVLSRKKYGSDRSSNSPSQEHSYSIAQQPVSIFDSANAHSISNLSNVHNSKQNIHNLIQQQSEANILQNNKHNQMVRNQQPLENLYVDPQKTGIQSQQMQTHSNSQTLYVDKKMVKKKQQSTAVHSLLNNSQNQSENILAKLQSLLINKEDERKSSNEAHQRIDKRGKIINNQQQANLKKQKSQQNYSNQRKSANSNPSLGTSHNRQSRYSQNSRYSRSKSRISRSKSSKKSGNSGNKNKNPKSQTKSHSHERAQPHQTNSLTGNVKFGNRSSSHNKFTNKQQDKMPNLQNVNHSVIVPSAKNKTTGAEQSHQLVGDQSVNQHVSSAHFSQLENHHQNSMEMNRVLTDFHDLHETHDGRDQMDQQHDKQNTQILHEKKRKGRSSAFRNRPKSSLLENHRESITNQKKEKKKAATKKNNKANNSSIENLQRQVLENQMILLNNLHAQNAQQSQHSQKQSKRNQNMQSKHNHNNSIGLMNNISNQQLFNQNQFIHDRNQAALAINQFQSQISQNMNKTVMSSGTSGTKKKSAARKIQNNANSAISGQSRLNNQNVVSSYNTSQILNHLANNMSNLQKSDHLKLTQQNLSSNLRNLANMHGPGASTSASTTGGQFLSGKQMKSRKMNNKRRGSIQNNGPAQLTAGNMRNHNEFINFEQMQQQLQGGMTLGGVDLMHQTANQQHLNNLAPLGNDNLNSSAQQQLQQTQNKLMQIHMQQSDDSQGPPFQVPGSQLVANGVINHKQMMNFIPHKNLMPKTTGSHAHLLNIQDDPSGTLQKQYNSLNQTGRTAGSLNKVQTQKKQKNQNLQNVNGEVPNARTQIVDAGKVANAIKKQDGDSQQALSFGGRF